VEQKSIFQIFALFLKGAVEDYKKVNSTQSATADNASPVLRQAHPDLPGLTAS
jgi:hypothetical protein